MKTMLSRDAAIERVKSVRAKGGYLLLERRKDMFRVKREGYVIFDWNTLGRIWLLLAAYRLKDRLITKSVKQSLSNESEYFAKVLK